VATAIGQHYTMTFGLSSENGSAGNTQLQVLAGPSTTLYTETMNGSYSDFQKPWVTETINLTLESPPSAGRSAEASIPSEIRTVLAIGGDPTRIIIGCTRDKTGPNIFHKRGLLAPTTALLFREALRPFKRLP
jgi:hypothetical protein